jgi:putative oxidoreductase
MLKVKALNWGLLILRVGIPLMMMLGHGWAKVSKLFSGAEVQFVDPLGLGAGLSFILITFSEFFCMFPVILGFYTRLFLVPPIIGMAVAAFLYHGSDPFGTKEKALLYLMVFIALFLTGPGSLALQPQRRKDKLKKRFLNFFSQ